MKLKCSKSGKMKLKFLLFLVSIFTILTVGCTESNEQGSSFVFEIVPLSQNITEGTQAKYTIKITPDIVIDPVFTIKPIRESDLRVLSIHDSELEDLPQLNPGNSITRDV